MFVRTCEREHERNERKSNIHVPLMPVHPPLHFHNFLDSSVRILYALYILLIGFTDRCLAIANVYMRSLSMANHLK